MKLLQFYLSLTNLIFLTAGISFAQPAKKPLPRIVFEKIYLHTDREHYAAGETIWYKAYLVNGQTNMLSNSSDSMKVEILDRAIKPILQQTILLADGLGRGDFKLPKDLPDGDYLLRANTSFTSFMGSNLQFEKPIRIYNNKESEGLKPNLGTDVKGSGSKAVVFSLSPKQSISFYPESGSMIEGVESVVAFRALGADGNTISAHGAIVDHKGREIIKFSTSRTGMGKFLLKPEAGNSYIAKGTYENGEIFETTLSNALLKGIAIQASWSDTSLNITLATNQQTLDNLSSHNFQLSARSKGRAYYNSVIALNQVNNRLEIPKNKIPFGISEFRLTDNAGRPECERLVFNYKPYKTRILVNRKVEYPDTGGRVSLSINLLDINSRPIEANLSISVVDSRTVPQNTTDIVSYLELRSELKGYIPNIRQYFDDANKSRHEDLDLLLMTQGWRDFLWRRIVDTALRKGRDIVTPEPLTLNANYQTLMKGTVKETNHAVVSDTIMLQDVSVKGKIKTRLLDQVFTSFGNDEIFQINPKDFKQTLLQYLLQQADASTTEQGNILIHGQPPLLVVDGVALPFTTSSDDSPIRVEYYNAYMYLPVSTFEKIVIKRGLDRSADAMMKIFPDENGHIQKVPDLVVLFLTSNPAVPKNTLERIKEFGKNFYQARRFADVVNLKTSPATALNTVFWEPNIITNELGELNIRFSTPAQSNNLSIIIEGITESNGPVSVFETLRF